MELAQALNIIGLTEKESAVYLASLELGQDTVSHISKKANLKRPTVYLVLNSLVQKGLINSLIRGKHTFYVAEEPKKLFSLVAQQERALKSVLPALEAINNRQKNKPKIRFFEGSDGLTAIYKEVLASKEIRWWGSVSAMGKKYKYLSDYFADIANKNKPRVYDLLADTPEDRAYAKKVFSCNYEIRFFLKKDFISIDSALFDNKFSIAAFDDNPHGLIIESQPIIDSFRQIWDLAWSSAIPYKLNKPTKKK